MLTLTWWFCLAGLVLSIVVDLTHKQVAKLIAPTHDGFFAIPRALLSMLWMTVVPVIARVLELVFLTLSIFLWASQQ